MMLRRLGIGLFCVSALGCQGLPRSATQPIDSIYTTTTVSLLNSEAVKHALYAQLAEWKAVRYDYGGLSKKGVDCSGFVYLTYRSNFGIELPRTTTEQADIGQTIEQERLHSGDLVFFKVDRTTKHVGMYVEGRKFLHASKTSGVRLSSLDNEYWAKKYWKAQRIEVRQSSI